MLKLYKAYADQGLIKIEDGINFTNGQYDTGYEGYGTVNLDGPSEMTTANYSLQTLKDFKQYLQTVKLNDGYLEHLTIWHAMTYDMLKEKYENISKDMEIYERNGLNEEGILLFTNYIHLIPSEEKLIKRLFGRYYYNGMYLLLPGASFQMTTGGNSNNVEDYEVLQSKKLGKQLVLAKMNRNILK